MSTAELSRAIRRAVELASEENEPDIARRCRSFVAYLAGRISAHSPDLAADVATILDWPRPGRENAPVGGPPTEALERHTEAGPQPEAPTDAG